MIGFPLVIAHRGASSIAPENTLPAFHKAVEMGCDAIELDVHPTKDDEVVVIHDSTLNRTTNGKGLVTDYTLNELKQLDAGEYFSKEFAGTKIPALYEVFELLQNSNLKVIIELKGSYTDLEKKVSALIREFGFQNRAIVSSYNHEYLKNIKKYFTDILIEADFTVPLTNIVKYAKNLSVNVVCPEYNYVEHMCKLTIKRLKRNNIRLFTYTVNSKEDMLHLIKKGVNGIMTDYPDILLEIKNYYGSKSVRVKLTKLLKISKDN